jgi:hypothetical protein
VSHNAYSTKTAKLRAECRLQSESDIYVLVIGLQTTGFVTTLGVHMLLQERSVLAASARNRPRSCFEYEGGHREIELRLVWDDARL